MQLTGGLDFKSVEIQQDPKARLDLDPEVVLRTRPQAGGQDPRRKTLNIGLAEDCDTLMKGREPEGWSRPHNGGRDPTWMWIKAQSCWKDFEKGTGLVTRTLPSSSWRQSSQGGECRPRGCAAHREDLRKTG